MTVTAPLAFFPMPSGQLRQRKCTKRDQAPLNVIADMDLSMIFRKSEPAHFVHRLASAPKTAIRGRVCETSFLSSTCGILGAVAEENAKSLIALFSGSEPAFARSSSHSALPIWLFLGTSLSVHCAMGRLPVASNFGNAKPHTALFPRPQRVSGDADCSRPVENCLTFHR